MSIRQLPLIKAEPNDVSEHLSPARRNEGYTLNAVHNPRPRTNGRAYLRVELRHQGNPVGSVDDWIGADGPTGVQGHESLPDPKQHPKARELSDSMRNAFNAYHRSPRFPGVSKTEPIAKRDPSQPAPTPKAPKVGALPKPPKPPKPPQPKPTQSVGMTTSMSMGMGKSELSALYDAAALDAAIQPHVSAIEAALGKQEPSAVVASANSFEAGSGVKLGKTDDPKALSHAAEAASQKAHQSGKPEDHEAAFQAHNKASLAHSVSPDRATSEQNDAAHYHGQKASEHKAKAGPSPGWGGLNFQRVKLGKSETDHVKEFVLGLDLGGTKRWHSACIAKDDSNFGRAIKGRQADRTYSREGSRGVPGHCAACGGELSLDPAPRKDVGESYGEENNEHKIEKGENVRKSDTDLSKGFPATKQNAAHLAQIAEASSNKANETGKPEDHEVASLWHGKASLAHSVEPGTDPKADEAAHYHSQKMSEHKSKAGASPGYEGLSFSRVKMNKSELLQGARFHYGRLVRFQQLNKADESAKAAEMCSLYLGALGRDPKDEPPAEVRDTSGVDLSKSSFPLDRQIQGLPEKMLPLIKADPVSPGQGRRTSSGKEVPDASHELYTAREKFPKWNTTPDATQEPRILARRTQGWTRQDHADAARIHAQDAQELGSQHAAHLDQGYQQHGGDRFKFVSGGHQEAWPEDVKNQSRQLVQARSAAVAASAAHHQLSGSRTPWRAVYGSDAPVQKAMSGGGGDAAPATMGQGEALAMAEKPTAYWVRSSGPGSAKDRVKMHIHGVKRKDDDEGSRSDIMASPAHLNSPTYTGTYGGDAFENEDGSPYRHGYAPRAMATVFGKGQPAQKSEKGDSEVIGQVGKGGGKPLDIGEGYKVHGHGYDDNGNHSVWVSKDGGRARKIQSGQNLPSVHSARGSGDKGKLPISKKIADEIKDYHRKYHEKSIEKAEPCGNPGDTNMDPLQKFKAMIKGGSELSKAQRAPRPTPQHNEDAVRELSLFAENDSGLHHSQEVPIQRNLANKMAGGQYDHAKAAKLYGYLADSAAKKYTQQFGGSGNGSFGSFSPADRRELGNRFADSFRTEAGLGNMDHHLQKQHQKQGVTLAGHPATQSGAPAGKYADQEQHDAIQFYSPGVAKTEGGMPRHDGGQRGGKLDRRYSIGQSYTGHASGKKQHVVRFAGKYVGSHETKEGAEALARDHAAKRQKTLSGK